MIDILLTTILICLTVVGVVVALIFATGFLYGLCGAIIYMMLWVVAYMYDKGISMYFWIKKRTIETNDDWTD